MANKNITDQKRKVEEWLDLQVAARTQAKFSFGKGTEKKVEMHYISSFEDGISVYNVAALARVMGIKLHIAPRETYSDDDPFNAFVYFRYKGMTFYDLYHEE